jgi:cytokinin dehydrogenase
MHQPFSRRSLLLGAAAATICAFDPVRRSWITSAQASETEDLLDELLAIPNLDGELVIDQTSLDNASETFGYLQQRIPLAVLRPGSVNDIKKVVEFASCNGIKIAMRGQGHCRGQQALVAGGVVIDSTTLTTIHSITPTHVVVDAGATLSQVIAATLPSGRTLPVIPNFMHLSCGGLCSAGGFGGATSTEGLFANNVLSVDVVDGTGVKRTCSRFFNRNLFEAVLGGVGQFGIIVKLTLRLVPAPAQVRRYLLNYTDLATFLDDQRLLVADGRFDDLSGSARFMSGAWVFTIEAAAFFTPPSTPNDTTLLAGLQHASSTIADFGYSAWAHRVDPAVAAQKASGVWYARKPWIDVFLPDSTAEGFISSALADLTADPSGIVPPILLFPFFAPPPLPLLKFPNENLIFVFGILRVAPDAVTADRWVEENLQLYYDAVAAGGTMYTIDAIPATPEDWTAHYGSSAGLVEQRKQQYDPNGVLTPGPGIFEESP